MWPFSKIRQRALKVIKQQLEYEDENTNYICVAPLNKLLNMVFCWIDEPDSPAFFRHLARLTDYLWLGEDGMKMQVRTTNKFIYELNFVLNIFV